MNKSKSKLLDILSRIQQDKKPENQHHHSRLLIIDGVNTFLRSFAAVNRVNYYGNHVGGITGFLLSIGSAIKQIQPTRCIIVFDGEGGSTNRKYLYPEYKANRNTSRLVNYKSFSSKTEENQSKVDEITRLIDYIKCLPVSIICVDKLEADDVIGYLCNKVYSDYDDSEIYVMSSDNDFMQLVNDRTFLFSPTKKKTYGIKEVIEEFSVHPENFLLYKTLVGDTSDNIPGINGFGEKNTIKMFEILQSDQRKNIEDLLEVCNNPPKKSILYERVLEMNNMLSIFYKIMNIREPNMTDDAIEDVNRQFYVRTESLQPANFIHLLREDGINDSVLNSHGWIRLFSFLNR